jgi:hypothetical protein
MRKLILLFIVFIILDRIGLLINVLVMNPETTTPPASVSELLEAFGFMLIFAFWHWIALYTSWIIANLLLFFFFGHSITRSIVAGASLPIVYLFFDATGFLTVWHLIMGTAFGFLSHKFVNTINEPIKTK